MRKFRIAVVSLVAAGLIAIGSPALAASPTGVVSYRWDNVIIDGQNYTIAGGYATTKNGKVTESHTTCQYAKPVDDGRFGYVEDGSYVVSGIQATTEADLKSFCIAHYADRT